MIRMKHAACGIVVGMMVATGGVIAQEQAGSESGARLSVGSTLTAVLNSSVDSKKVKVGDLVSAHTLEAVKADGKVIIPKGAKLVGHVTQASARGKGDADSVVGIKFDKAVLKKGEEVPLNLWIRAIAAEPRVAFQNGPDPNAMAGPGTAAAAGSPMKTAPQPIPQPQNGAANAPASGSRAAGPDIVPGENVNGGADTGLNAAGEFSPNSRGVYGLDGLRLHTDASNEAQGSLITSTGKSAQIESGTRFLLVAQ